VTSDCQTCGACCFSESERHARVTGDDYERLGDDAEALVVFVANRAFMRIVGSPGARRCIALEAKDGRFSCRVYGKRPQVCRDLERGSPACEGEILIKRRRIDPAVAVWDD
jgi:Fe-S-cluster containining protein